MAQQRGHSPAPRLRTPPRTRTGARSPDRARSRADRARSRAVRPRPDTAPVQHWHSIRGTVTTLAAYLAESSRRAITGHAD
jgi:hypothetical protein